jgi:NAD(P)-dependent dehydrogenase (short-subunit alcohol dehydrogenase family)
MKHVLITGATSGIGLDTAKHFDALNWKVYAVGLPQDDTRALLSNASNITFVPMDITQSHSVTQAFERITQLDALVNCAGVNIPAPLEILPIEQFQQQLEVNVIGQLRVIQQALPLLRTTHGHIVNVSSLMGKVAMPILGAYSASKHAFEAMSDVLRMELSKDGIRVSVIVMGAIDTPMTKNMVNMLDKAQQWDTHGYYRELFASMRQALVGQSKTAISAQKVTQVIVQAVESKNPKPRYEVGGAVQGLIFMRRFSPLSIGDKILKHALNIKN